MNFRAKEMNTMHRQRPVISGRPIDGDLDLQAHRDLVEGFSGQCVTELMSGQLHEMCELASVLSTDRLDSVDPPYRWTVRQVFAHLVDAERIFGDRMLRVAAGDRTDLPSWDQDAYANARFGLGNFGQLVTELGHLRQANLLLLRRLAPKAWDQRGNVGGSPMTVRGLAWVCAAHMDHHFKIVRQRCDVASPNDESKAGDF